MNNFFINTVYCEETIISFSTVNQRSLTPPFIINKKVVFHPMRKQDVRKAWGTTVVY